ncbi:DgyrCDS13944 [Dimorphilus gyrociliatus]|uniref:Protein ABHD13 n=1 Tax=Dimorphilus gyrociliatus TaxID=2664684 RepID=A0A7I8WC44_9ANNE|nr:DgyrCDS13944 [Dimorphilus gyrociliatus]
MKDEDDNKPLIVKTESSRDSENCSAKQSHSRNCSSCSQRVCHTMQSSGDFRLSDLSWKDICKIVLDLLKIYAKNSWKLLSLALLGVVLIYMLVGGLLTFFAVVLGIIAKFYYVQDNLLYHPNMPSNSRLFSHTPETFYLPGVDETENLMITTKDNVKIHIEILMQSVEKRAQAPTIVFFHGNAGNIGHRLPNAFAMFVHLGANVVLVEYRGYGRSSGTPSEYGLYYDAESALDFVLNHPKLGSSGVIVFGRSLGGAIAIYLASHPQYSQKIFALYSSLSRIKHISVPSLFISGQADTLVPKEMMNTLYEVRNLKNNPSTPPTRIYDVPASLNDDAFQEVRVS